MIHRSKAKLSKQWSMGTNQGGPKCQRVFMQTIGSYLRVGGDIRGNPLPYLLIELRGGGLLLKLASFNDSATVVNFARKRIKSALKMKIGYVIHV